MRHHPKVLMYHGIIPRQKEWPCQKLKVVYQDDLRRQLKFLQRFFQIISPDDLCDAIKLNRKLPENALLITFDDGLRNTFEYALPVAEELRIPIIIFCCTQNIRFRKWLWFSRITCAELRENKPINDFQNNYKSFKLNKIESFLERIEAPDFKDASSFEHLLFDGVTPEELKKYSNSPYLEIGGHTTNHPRLTNESEHFIFNEIKDNKLFLEEIVGKEIRFFAYPEGEVNENIAQITQNIGYTTAFSVTKNDINKKLQKFSIPRIGIYRGNIFYSTLKILLNRH